MVTEVTSPWLVKVNGEVLDKDDLMHPVLKWSESIAIATKTHVGGIGGREADVGHDGDHHMLLHVELSGVETPGISKGGKPMSRKNLLQEFTRRKSATHDQLSVVAREELERARRTATGRR